jgi:hypothetical protein
MGKNLNYFWKISKSKFARSHVTEFITCKLKSRIRTSTSQASPPTTTVRHDHITATTTTTSRNHRVTTMTTNDNDGHITLLKVT